MAKQKQFHIITQQLDSEEDARKLQTRLNNSKEFGKEADFMIMTVETPD